MYYVNFINENRVMSALKDYATKMNLIITHNKTLLLNIMHIIT